ncbi:MAG: ABC transporter ATP-binding protein/permease, partial [Chloroflexota bacterium]|nr:ABC transporter ATP-binding protein/permease [Chloroflexota bacterium]
MKPVSANAGGSLGTWQVLWQLIRARPWHFVLNLALQVPRQSVFLVTGLVVARYFEVVSAGATGDAATILVLVAVLLGTYAARIAIIIGAVATNETYVQHGAALLRRNAFAHLLARPGALPLTFAPGEVVSRLMGDAQTVSGFQYRLLRTLGDAAMAIAAVVVLARVDTWLTVLVVLPVLLVGAAGNAARRRVQRYQRGHRDAVGRSRAFLGDVFETVQAIQVAGAEERMAHRFSELNARRRDTALQGRLFGEAIGVLTHGTAAVGIGAVLLLVANAIRRGTFTVGELTLFAYYLPAMTTFTSSLGNLLIGFQRATVSVERLVAVLEGSPPTTLLRRSAPSSATPLLTGDQPGSPPVIALEQLEVRGLSYRHPGSDRGIEGVSLVLSRGGCAVITGRTGSGKTTLLRVLLGLLPWQAGEIFWNGQVVHNPGTFFVPPRTAYAPQAPHLFCATLRENILLGLFVPSPGGFSSQPSRLLGTEGTQDVRETVSDQGQL